MNTYYTTDMPALWRMKQFGLFKIRTSFTKYYLYKNICDQLVLLYISSCRYKDVTDR